MKTFNPYGIFYGALIPDVLLRYKKITPSAKLLYAKLVQYAGKDGNCFPSIDTLAEDLGLSVRQIITLLKILEKDGFIVKVKATGKDKLIHKNNQYLFLLHKIFEETLNVESNQNSTNFTSEGEVEFTSGCEKEFTSNNNKIVNNKIVDNNIYNICEEDDKKRFKKPTVEEIKEYCIERSNGIDAQQFYDFYEAKNWYIGKNKMKDWKAAVRTWERNRQSNNYNNPGRTGVVKNKYENI